MGIRTMITPVGRTSETRRLTEFPEKPQMLRLARETPEDVGEVETLLDLAFTPARMALASYALRRDAAPVGELCKTVRDEFGTLVGCIRFWPVQIGREGTPALLLGPIAVHPTRRSEGIGRLLIGNGLSDSVTLGWRLVVLIGDAPYYEKFGFRPAGPLGLRFPPPVNEERFLICELTEGAAKGVTGMVQTWNN